MRTLVLCDLVLAQGLWLSSCRGDTRPARGSKLARTVDGYHPSIEFRTSSVFRGWVRVRILGYGFGVWGRKVKSRDLT